MRLYIPQAMKYLANNETCQYPLGCDQPSVCIHHKRGRFGKRLLDQRYWAASCIEHNDYAETDTGPALACGWLLPIEGAYP